MSNFKNTITQFLNYIPGFRHRNKIVMILACLYYLFSLIVISISVSFIQKIGAFLFMSSVPFFIVYMIDLFKKYNIFWDAVKHSNENRRLVNKNLIMIILSLLTFSFGIIFIGIGAPKTESKEAIKIESENAVTNSAKPSVTIKPSNNIIVKPTTTTAPLITKSSETTSIPEKTNEVTNVPTIAHVDTASNIEEPRATEEPKSTQEPKSTEEPKLETATPTIEPTIEPTINPEPKPFPTAQVTAGDEVFEVSYIGNANSKKFHESDCGEVKKIKSSNIVKLSSREKAINNDYVPCKKCNP